MWGGGGGKCRNFKELANMGFKIYKFAYFFVKFILNQYNNWDNLASGYRVPSLTMRFKLEIK